MVFDLNTTKPRLDMKSRPLRTRDSVLGHFISYFKKDWLSIEQGGTASPGIVGSAGGVGRLLAFSGRGQ